MYSESDNNRREKFMIKPAVIAVGYNRPESLKRLLKSISMASYPFDDITLVISIDGGDLSSECCEAADSFVWEHGEKVVRHFKERQGLKKHVIQCGDLSEQYGAVIVLEDDIFVSPSFYLYTYAAVNHYADCEWAAGVSLYSHMWNGYADMPFMPYNNGFDVYLGQFSISWGQCWTWHQWKRFRNWYDVNEGKLPSTTSQMPESILHWGDHSWGMYYVYFVVAHDLYYIMPYRALSTNFSEAGQHTGKANSVHQVPLLNGIKKDYSFPDFSGAVKYDIFCERMFDSGTSIGGIDGREICTDFYGLKKEAMGKGYILTDRKLNLSVVRSFGMTMRPVEANAVYDIAGSDIFLYRADNPHMSLIHTRHMTPARRSYELFAYTARELVTEGVKRFHPKGYIKKAVKKLLRPFIKH